MDIESQNNERSYHGHVGLNVQEDRLPYSFVPSSSPNPIQLSILRASDSLSSTSIMILLHPNTTHQYGYSWDPRLRILRQINRQKG